MDKPDIAEVKQLVNLLHSTLPWCMLDGRRCSSISNQVLPLKAWLQLRHAAEYQAKLTTAVKPDLQLWQVHWLSGQSRLQQTAARCALWVLYSAPTIRNNQACQCSTMALGSRHRQLLCIHQNLANIISTITQTVMTAMTSCAMTMPSSSLNCVGVHFKANVCAHNCCRAA